MHFLFNTAKNLKFNRFGTFWLILNQNDLFWSRSFHSWSTSEYWSRPSLFGFCYVCL